MGLQAQLAQAQAAQAALQLSGGLSAGGAAGAAQPAAGQLDGSPSQLISLLSANAAVAAAAAAGAGGLPAAGAGAPMVGRSPSMGQLSLSRGSSHNDLVGLLAQQQAQQAAAAQQQQAAEQQIGAGKPPLPSGWHAAAGLPPAMRGAGMPSVQGTVGPASARAGGVARGRRRVNCCGAVLCGVQLCVGSYPPVNLPQQSSRGQQQHRGPCTAQAPAALFASWQAAKACVPPRQVKHALSHPCRPPYLCGQAEQGHHGAGR